MAKNRAVYKAGSWAALLASLPRLLGEKEGKEGERGKDWLTERKKERREGKEPHSKRKKAASAPSPSAHSSTSVALETARLMSYMPPVLGGVGSDELPSFLFDFVGFALNASLESPSPFPCLGSRDLTVEEVLFIKPGIPLICLLSVCLYSHSGCSCDYNKLQWF